MLWRRTSPETPSFRSFRPPLPPFFLFSSPLPYLPIDFSITSSSSPCLLLARPSTSSRSAPSRLRPARYFQIDPRLWSLCADGSISPKASKVAVLGAAGGIGQPLSLLMKLNPRVTELALYDIRGGPGTLWLSVCHYGDLI